MKTTLIGLAVALLLLVAGALVAPSFIDWTQHREQIATRLSQATGHTVAIDGTVDLTLLPTPILTASGVRVTNDRGDERFPNMMEVAAADLRVAMLPLLRGTVQVERVVLVDPMIVIERLPDGGLNWAQGQDLALASGAVQLDRVTVENGRVIWHDPERGVTETVEELFGQLSAASLTGPYSLLGSFRARGLPFAIDLQTGRRSPSGALPVNLTIGVDGASDELRFAGLIAGDHPLQGDLTLRGTDLGGLVRRLAPDLLDASLPAEPYRLQSPLVHDGRAVRLAAITAELGAGRATGRVDLDLSGAAPALDLSIGMTRLDGDGWAGAIAELAALETPEDRLLAWFDGLGEARVAAELSLDTLDLREGIARQIRVDLEMRDGVISLSRLSAQLPGATDLLFQGNLRVIEGGVHGESTVQVTSGDFRRVLGWLGVPVDRVPGDRLRHFAATGRFSGGSQQFQLSGIDIALDDTRLTGGLAFVDRGRIGLGLRLALDRLNLDAYRAEEEIGDGWAESILAWLADEAIADPLLALLLEVDANVDVRLGRFTANRLSAEGLRLDGTLRQGSLVLREAAVDGVAGARLHLAGEADSVLPLRGVDLVFDGRINAWPSFLDRIGLPLEPGRDLDWLGRIELAGTLRGDPDALEMDLEGGLAGGYVQAGGRIDDPLGEMPTGTLAIRVRHEAPDALARRFDWPLTAEALAGGVDLYAEVARNADGYRLEEVQGTLGPLALAGTVTLEPRTPRPRLTVDLRTSDVVLERYFGPRRQQPGSARATGLRWSFLPFDFTGLHALDGTLAMNSTALHWGDFVLAEPIVRASLVGGTLEVSTFLGHTLGGTLGGSGFLDAAEVLESGGASPGVAVTVNLVDADAAETLSSLLGAGGLAGTLDFGGAFEARGVSPAEWVSTLSGEGLVAVRDGILHDIDLAGLTNRLSALERPLDFIDVMRQTLVRGSSPFGALNATYRVSDGIVRTDDLRVVGPDGFGEGRGLVDLNSWTVDLTTEFSLYMIPDAPPVGVHFTGPLEAPERRLNAQSLQAFVAQRAAEALSRRVLEGANPIEADILGDRGRRYAPDDIPGLRID